MSNTPKPSSERQLTAFSIQPGPTGERLPVRAIFPGHVPDAECIAALVEGAAVDAGIDFASFLKLVRTAAPPEGQFQICPPSRPTGRPARDWEEDYGKSAAKLGLAATIRRVLNPAMTWMEALRTTLIVERRSERKHARPSAAIKTDAAKLKQAVRIR